VKRPNVFTPVVVYNLTLMAIEKFLMAVLLRHHTMPYNHTMTDIIDMVETVIGPQPELAADLRWLDSFQEVCDVDRYRRREPTPDEIRKVLAIGAKVAAFARHALVPNENQPASYVDRSSETGATLAPATGHPV